MKELQVLCVAIAPHQSWHRNWTCLLHRRRSAWPQKPFGCKTMASACHVWCDCNQEWSWQMCCSRAAFCKIRSTDYISTKSAKWELLHACKLALRFRLSLNNLWIALSSRIMLSGNECRQSILTSWLDPCHEHLSNRRSFLQHSGTLQYCKMSVEEFCCMLKYSPVSWSELMRSWPAQSAQSVPMWDICFSLWDAPITSCTPAGVRFAN